MFFLIIGGRLGWCKSIKLQDTGAVSSIGKLAINSNLTDDVSVENDSMSHQGGSVSLLHQDISRAVVDVFEAVRTQQNSPVPPGHNHQDVTHIQNLLVRDKHMHVNGV